MGLRGINPLVFTAFVANQLDPALNFGARPGAPRARANDAEHDGDAVTGDRDDQVRITDMDQAVPGVQAEESKIDESQTQLDSARLRQEVGGREAVDLGHNLDLLT